MGTDLNVSSIFPSRRRYARLHLPSDGFRGPQFPIITGTSFRYDYHPPISAVLGLSVLDRGYLVASAWFCVPFPARDRTGSLRIAPGPCYSGFPLTPGLLSQEANGSLKFPSFHCEDMPWSKTTVVSPMQATLRMEDCCFPAGAEAPV
jgi:hypothetical protein